MSYLSPEQLPERCRDPHHADPRVPHGDRACERCPECLHWVQEAYISAHRQLHAQEHPYREPSHR